ncbi:hypothetical protein ACIPSQ_16930 [Pectobacterium parvum]|uniref:hypothetical protein n=1 Tax=Pectobacterium TaxID=122277 RepID=UPI0013FD1E30|nr:hypothetical protein [Pectobacterium polaris]
MSFHERSTIDRAGVLSTHTEAPARRKARYTAPACTIWIIKILQKKSGANHTASQRGGWGSGIWALLHSV